MALILRGRTALAGATTVGWSPAALFANGEQGAWYDPSDFARYMTPSDTELVTNGDFVSGTTGWSFGATTTLVGEAAFSNATPSGSNILQQSNLQPGAGKWIRISFTVSGWTGGDLRIFINNDSTVVTVQNGANSLVTLSNFGSGSGLLVRAGNSAFTGTIDNISVRELTAISTATMFTDTAGTTPVTAVGQQVARINDKSGRGNHATQATAGNRPVLQVENGRYYLEFDGATSNRWLQTGNVDFTATDKMTVVTGIRKLSDAAAGCVVELTTGGLSGAFAIFNLNSAAYNITASRASQNTGVTASVYTAPISNVISANMDLTAGSNLLKIGPRIDGIVPSIADVGGVPTAGAGTFANAALFIGRRAGTSFPFNGRIYSLLVRGATTTATDIARTERYVANRTGVLLP